MKEIKQYASGEITAEEIGPLLAPGCSVEKKTETRTKFRAGKPILVQKRKCGRITGCDDSGNNTDWSCGDWYDT